LDALNKAFELINILGADRRKYLEERREFHRFGEEADEECMWLQEKIDLVRTTEPGHDLSSSQILLNKQEQLEDELKFRMPRIDKMVAGGDQLVASKRFSQRENAKIISKCETMQSKFAELKEAAHKRRTLLEDSYSSQQYFADANEAQSWISDKMALVVALNVDNSGHDEASSQALLQRHVRVQEEIKAYEPEINRLREITDVLVGARRFSSLPIEKKKNLVKNQQQQQQDTTDTDLTEDEDLQKGDVSKTEDESFVEEIEIVDQFVDREVHETFVEEVRVPCVKALYQFQSKTFSLQRGEVLELKEKSNDEWWLVENSVGVEGFAPATYLKEMGMQSVAKQQERIVIKPELTQVRKTIRKRPEQPANTNAATTAAIAVLSQHQKATKKKASSLRRKTTSIQPRQLQFLSPDSLQKRQAEINVAFNNLLNASIEKRKQLDMAIAFLKWLRKYEELNKWVSFCI
jgi:spectrin beta